MPGSTCAYRVVALDPNPAAKERRRHPSPRPGRAALRRRRPCSHPGRVGRMPVARLLPAGFPVAPYLRPRQCLCRAGRLGRHSLRRLWRIRWTKTTATTAIAAMPRCVAVARSLARTAGSVSAPAASTSVPPAATSIALPAWRRARYATNGSARTASKDGLCQSCYEKQHNEEHEHDPRENAPNEPVAVGA